MADLPLKVAVTGDTCTVSEVPWSDTVYAFLRYNLRRAYATQAAAGGIGNFGTVSSGGNAGTATNTARTQRVNTSAGNNSPGVQSSDYPGYPGTGDTSNTYRYNHNRTTSAEPSANLGMLTHVSGGTLGHTFTEAQIDTNIITPTINEMKTGDEVGTYRVGASSPGTGWVNQGTIFTDTRYGYSQNYYLWLKTTDANAPTAPTDALLYFPYRNGAGMYCHSLNPTGALIQNYLLPLLNRQIANGDLTYTISTTAPTGTVANHGSFIDTRLTGTTSSQQHVGINDYRSYSTPSGSSVIINTYYLHRT